MLASKESIDRVIAALTDHNIQTIVVSDRLQALAQVQTLIPSGASVVNGSSVTLQEIGYIDYLKAGTHGWHNRQADVIAEKDPIKQALLRKEASISDYYLGSVHALTEEGEMIIASGSGSQLPGIVYNAANLIFVVGAQKIVPDLAAGFVRLKEHVFPLENERVQKAYGYGATLAKTLIFHRELANSGRVVRVILVNESLGF